MTTDDVIRPTAEEQAANERATDEALHRIRRGMIAISVAAFVFLLIGAGWRVAGGFLVGSALAYLGFVWLKETATGLLALVIQSPAKPPMGRVGKRFLLRYVLIAVIAYVIFISSAVSVYGFFAGLFVPAAAILVEAVYQVGLTLRHES